MIANYIEIFLRKKKTKSVNMCMNNIEIFRQKKQTKSINMQVSDTDVFLKSFDFLQKHKKLVFKVNIENRLCLESSIFRRVRVKQFFRGSVNRSNSPLLRNVRHFFERKIISLAKIF